MTHFKNKYVKFEILKFVKISQNFDIECLHHD